MGCAPPSPISRGNSRAAADRTTHSVLVARRDVKPDSSRKRSSRYLCPVVRPLQLRLERDLACFKDQLQLFVSRSDCSRRGQELELDGDDVRQHACGGWLRQSSGGLPGVPDRDHPADCAVAGTRSTDSPNDTRSWTVPLQVGDLRCRRSYRRRVQPPRHPRGMVLLIVSLFRSVVVGLARGTGPRSGRPTAPSTPRGRR
jgi:hypothetical protein